MSQTVVLKVGMSCQGCVGAVNRVLGKMDGVDSFEINLEQQKVTVKGNVEPEAVLQTVSKTGKKTSFWEEEAPAAPDSKPEEEAAVATGSKPAEAAAAAAATESKPAEAAAAAATESKPTEAVAAA